MGFGGFMSLLADGAIAALATLAVVAATPAWATEGPQTTWVLRTAQFAEGDGSTFPPPPAAPARLPTVKLPDEWAESRPGFQGTLWYRIELPEEVQQTAAPGELLALSIERVCGSVEVYLNGQLVAGDGRLRESGPVTHLCNHPQLVSLPAALWNPLRNRIDIKVFGHRLAEVGSARRAGGLSTLVLGPQALLATRHARQSALAVGFTQGASATLLLMGGFMFVLGYANRRESRLAYFGAFCLGLALFDARLWLRDLALLQRVSEVLLLALLGFITWAAVQFLLRCRGTRLRAADVGLPAQCLLVVLTLLATPVAYLHALALLWTGIFALEIGAAGALLLRQPGPAETRWTAGLLLAGMSLAVSAGTLGSSAVPGPGWVAEAALPLVVIFVGLRLVMLHGRARREAEASRALLEESKIQLEQRVHEATLEIERNMRAMADLKIEQVAERERKRIAADLHDDLGAKLLTIVHTSESDRISTLAREALEEMRLSVRGLTGRKMRLADAMGDWRAETVSRLAQAGIEGEWHGPEEAPQMLSARAYVQTTRILREATSNVIKHSGASYCSVRCANAAGDFQLVIQDNGNGISQDVDARLDRGHGLASMKNRAKQLQGQCLVESGPGYGTVIRLTLPLDRATGAS